MRINVEQAHPKPRFGVLQRVHCGVRDTTFLSLCGGFSYKQRKMLGMLLKLMVVGLKHVSNPE